MNEMLDEYVRVVVPALGWPEAAHDDGDIYLLTVLDIEEGSRFVLAVFRDWTREKLEERGIVVERKTPAGGYVVVAEETGDMLFLSGQFRDFDYDCDDDIPLFSPTYAEAQIAAVKAIAQEPK